MTRFRCPTDPKKAVDAARSSTTSIEQLEVLAESRYVFVKEEVACHPSTTSDLLSRLAPPDLSSDSNLRLAMAVARNARASTDTLGRLAELIPLVLLNGSKRENWRYEALATELLTHLSFPPEHAQEVLSSEHVCRGVRMRVARQAKQKAIVEILAQDKSLHVRNAASMRLDELAGN